MDPDPHSLPLGRNGRLEAVPISSGGDHALLVREADEHRALLTASADERLILVPLDERAELRVDGDALAVWLGSAPITRGGATPGDGTRTPAWASAIGLVLLLAIVGLAILGSFTFFGWLFGGLGWIR